MHEIHAKQLLVRVDTVDTGDESMFMKHLAAFCDKRGIRQRFVSRDGHVLLSSSSDRMIRLRAGMKTLRVALGMAYTPTLLNDYKPLPYPFLSEYFTDGYDGSRVAQAIGSMYTEAVIRDEIANVVSKCRNRMRNAEIVTTSTQRLVATGTIAIAQAGQIDTNKRLVERLTRMSDLKADLTGEFVFRFEQYVPSMDDPSTFVVCGVHEPVHVSLRGAVDDVSTKRKHLYVYSHAGGFGKTRELDRLRAAYNAHYVTDVRNWMNVPDRAQLLLFDEVSPKRCPPLADLKILTGGSATAFAGNCKSHGESFAPRADVQVVMMSNRSLYDVYGEWDARLQRRVMSRDVAQQLDQRFIVVCLDGDATVDRRAAMDAKDWTAGEFGAKMKALFVEPTEEILRPTTGEQSVEYCLGVVGSAWTLWRARHGSRQPCMFREYVSEMVTVGGVYFPCRRRTVTVFAMIVTITNTVRRAKLIETLIERETPRPKGVDVDNDSIRQLLETRSQTEVCTAMLDSENRRCVWSALATFLLADMPAMVAPVRTDDGYFDAKVYDVDAMTRIVGEHYFDTSEFDPNVAYLVRIVHPMLTGTAPPLPTRRKHSFRFDRLTLSSSSSSSSDSDEWVPDVKKRR